VCTLILAHSGTIKIQLTVNECDSVDRIRKAKLLWIMSDNGTK